MKMLKNLSILVIILSLTACGFKDSNDPNLTPLQNDAVTYVKRHLEKRDKLMEYQVVEQPMPPAILQQPFLNLRNTVFKAGLDYQSCKTRGLQSGMDMADQKIESARQKIIDTEEIIRKNTGDSNFLIVLAKVKTPALHDGNLESLVVVFDPSTMEAKEWIPVTTPVQNNVAMVVCANDNTLAEYAKEQNNATDILSGKVTDPVLKFVLEAKAL